VISFLWPYLARTFLHANSLSPHTHIHNNKLQNLRYASLVDKSGSAMTTLLDQTIDHALVRTVSSNRTTNVDDDEEEAEKEGVFYNENTGLVDRRLLFPYLPLWLSVLTPYNKSLCSWGAAQNAGSRVVKSIYGELLRCILNRLEQLDLRIRERKEGDNENEVQPMFPKDYTIFLNLVVFCEKLLAHRCVKEFQVWLKPTVQCLIQMDRKFDGEISGVYKLIELSLRISAKTIESREDVLDLLTPFMFTLLKRVTQLKDELLLSTLRCVLVSPNEIVRRIGVSVFIPALKQAFRLGLRHNPIASFGLRTLERFAESQKDVDSILPILLPSLESFLSLNAAAESDESLAVAQDDGTSQAIIAKKKKKKKKNMNNVNKNSDKKSKTDDLRDLQVHVLRFLGRLGGRNRFVTGSLTEGSQHDALKLGLRWASPETVVLRDVRYFIRCIIYTFLFFLSLTLSHSKLNTHTHLGTHVQEWKDGSRAW